VAEYWLQVLTNGATSGLVLALLSSAFAVVYIATNKFHLSLCAIFVAAPAAAYGVMRAGFGWFPATVIAVSLGAGLSWVVGVLNHERLERKNASAGAHLISGLGLYLVLGQVLVLVMGSESKMLRPDLDRSLKMGTVVVTHFQLLGALSSIAVLATLVALIRWSRAGIRLRALSYNPAECELRGIDVGQVRGMAFAVAGLLGAASGLLAASESGFDPNGGLLAGLPAIVALIIGGRQSFLGPILGALLIGVVRSTTVWCLSAGWQEPATFLVLAAFLVLRPNGILQRPGTWEVGA
jgi:branched-chain amino acid transport system permease protein